MGADVHYGDDSNRAVHLFRRTALAECIATIDTKYVLHGDSGPKLGATTVLVMLTWLCVRPSNSRLHVRDDHAFVESLFRTAKTAWSSLFRHLKHRAMPAPEPLSSPRSDCLKYRTYPSASGTKSVRIELLKRQPTMRLVYTSITKARTASPAKWRHR